MDSMRPCIVGFFDVIGIRRALQHRKADAVQAMQMLEAHAYGYASQNQDWYDGLYVWNDSVLAVTYLDVPNGSVLSTFNALHKFKANLSTNHYLSTVSDANIFAICIKGMAFVPTLDGIRANFSISGSTESKYVYVRASSMALINCFEIAEKLGRKRFKEWYVDERIYKDCPESVRAKLKIADELEMYPDMEKRKVYMGSGPLF